MAKHLCSAAIALSLVTVSPAVAVADEGNSSSSDSGRLTSKISEQIEARLLEEQKAQEQQKLQNVVSRANEELGTPYRNGGVGPNGYDCSGLVGYCITGNHERIGTTWTYLGWERVSADEAQPGDVVVCSSHTGIYIGDGMMIHAPRSGKVVEVAEVYSNMIYVKAPTDLLSC